LKPLRVEESAVGTGGLCGSAFLNYRFEEHVRSRLGIGRFDEMKLKKGKTWQMGLRYFEEFVKRNFNEDEYQEVNIPCATRACPLTEMRHDVTNTKSGFPGYPMTKKPVSTRVSWS
jgi:hypothetical protein